MNSPVQQGDHHRAAVLLQGGVLFAQAQADLLVAVAEDAADLGPILAGNDAGHALAGGLQLAPAQGQAEAVQGHHGGRVALGLEEASPVRMGRVASWAMAKPVWRIMSLSRAWEMAISSAPVTAGRLG